MEKYRPIIESVKANGNWFRQGKTFCTSNSFFFLDTGTGKIFRVNENVFRVLDCLFKTNNFDNLYKIRLPKSDLEAALEEICEAMKSESLFAAPPLSTSNIGGRHANLKENLAEGMRSLTLELTEQCNLRCKYCLYGDTNKDYRFFGKKEMSYDTARKAIDFLMSHSKHDEKVYVGFYGGEPLLRFPLIKQIVRYIKDTYPNRTVDYSMTTNMTLMTEEIADFLANIEGMSVVVSMDGPEQIHNKNRVFPDGTGSFSYALKGLRNYLKAKKQSINKDIPMMFSTVLDQPYDTTKFELMNTFFDSLREECSFSVLVSYVSSTTQPERYVYNNSRPENRWNDNNNTPEMYDPLISWTLNNLNDKNFSMSYFRRGALLEIHYRRISDKPFDSYTLNGCCVPGGRRLYVTTDGNFLPCERIGTQLPIGNVDDGFDFEHIQKNYIDDFIEQEVKYCGECWAVNLCSNCYMDCFGDNHIDFSYRHKLCRNTRSRISESLSIYHEIMDRYPEIIYDLNDIQLE